MPNIVVSQAWLEMEDIRRRRYSTSVWIPLRLSEIIRHEGQEHRPNSKTEYLAANCVAVPLHRREEEELTWNNVSLMHDGGPYALSVDNYKHSEIFRLNDIDDFGVDLVTVQHLDADLPSIWHINQDMILALNLIEDGEFWVRPEEGFVQVIRHRRNASGRSIAIEMKSEFLKDYLAARGMALRLCTYRQRTAIVQDRSFLTWDSDADNIETDQDRLSHRIWEVDAEGSMADRSMAVFHVSRTDVDEGEDVPIY